MDHLECKPTMMEQDSEGFLLSPVLCWGGPGEEENLGSQRSGGGRRHLEDSGH